MSNKTYSVIQGCYLVIIEEKKMTISELIFISIGLAMDSCTMATYLGMSSQKLSFKKIILIGVIFGLFQAIMPLIGYLFGNTFAHFIEKISHWIAF